MKRYNLFAILTTLLLAYLLSSVALARNVVTVGIVIDGPIEHISWSPELFKNEFLAMSQADFDIRFPAEKQLDGAWSATRIAAALEQLQQDPEVDMVLALGYVSGAVAALSGPMRKPTFAPLVMGADLQGLPRKGNASGIKNLNYLSGTADFVRDLKLLKSVVDFKKIAVLVDEAHYAAEPGLIRRAREVTAAGGVEIQFVLQHSRNENLAEKIPEDADVVVVTDLGRLDPVAMKQLIAALIEKRLPSYSLLDSQLVEMGIMMAEAPASDWRRLARRNALNMHEVLHGKSAESLPVFFESKRRLTINMATARAIGIYPSFDILNEAILLNEEPELEGRRLTLSAVALEAVKANLDLRADTLQLNAGKADIDEARAGLLPQLNADIRYSQLNDDSVATMSGAAAEKSTSIVLSLSQTLYSDAIDANVDIQGYLQENRIALNRQLELDIIQEATLAFLNVLKAQTFVRIRRENMKLTRANLELAKDRQRIGVANPAEVYRWDSELATSRQALLAAQSQLQQIRDTLNRLLHRPLTERFIAQPATLDDPSLIVSHPELFDYVSNDRSFELMGEFMIKEGLQVSPELASIDAQTAAIKRELKSNQRAYWSPTIRLQGEVSSVLDEYRSAGLPAENNTDWIVGINASLPLFEGGARRARLSGSQQNLARLNVYRDAIGERIKQRIRVSLHKIEASYPSIQLSNDAARAAHKSLEIVTDAYSRGAISILDLLDAQSAALVAEESAANAVFNFLIDLMNLQRSLGGFDFFLDAQGLDAWLERLQRYIASAEH